MSDFDWQAETLRLRSHAEFWERRYKTQHGTVHGLEDALAAERARVVSLQQALRELTEAAKAYQQYPAGVAIGTRFGHALARSDRALAAAATEDGAAVREEEHWQAETLRLRARVVSLQETLGRIERWGRGAPLRAADTMRAIAADALAAAEDGAAVREEEQ